MQTVLQTVLDTLNCELRGEKCAIALVFLIIRGCDLESGSVREVCSHLRPYTILLLYVEWEQTFAYHLPLVCEPLAHCVFRLLYHNCTCMKMVAHVKIVNALQVRFTPHYRSCVQCIIEAQLQKIKHTIADIKTLDSATATAEERLSVVRASIRSYQQSNRGVSLLIQVSQSLAFLLSFVRSVSLI